MQVLWRAEQSRVLFRKQPRLYILKVVYSQSLTAIGDGLWSLGDLVVVVHKSWSAEPFFQFRIQHRQQPRAQCFLQCQQRMLSLNSQGKHFLCFYCFLSHLIHIILIRICVPCSKVFQCNETRNEVVVIMFRLSNTYVPREDLGHVAHQSHQHHQ